MQITFQAMIFPTLATLATLTIRAYRISGVSFVALAGPRKSQADGLRHDRLTMR
jgi:hypothetical protein